MIYQIISAVDFVMKHSIFYSILYLVLYKFIQSLPKYGVVGLEFTRLLETGSGKIAPFYSSMPFFLHQSMYSSMPFFLHQ